MCGILGGNCKEWDYKKGILSMRHRGPDGQRIVQFNQFTLGFARLAILDLTDKGMQPMFSSHEEICMVYNGEIYGFEKLRLELIEKGYRFQSRTDSEVIVNAYLEYNDEFVKYIDGMFAIAIYDLRTQQIKLFRDRTGIKPLYYLFDGKNFGFASELKGILSMGQNLKYKIDYTALYDYITFGYIPEPKSLYQNIYKLPPAHKLVFDIPKRRIVSNSSYWELKINDRMESKNRKEEIQEEARRLIKKSVAEQMVSDVPVGSFLSGGIDSSIISYEIFRQNPEIESFSMGFPDKKYDETGYAKKLVDRYSMLSNVEYMSQEEFSHIYRRLPQWFDEPFADTASYGNYKISEAAKKKVTVVLTGDGGDEVFGGYARYAVYAQYYKKRRLHTELFSKPYENIISRFPKLYFEKVDELLANDYVKYGQIEGYLRKGGKTEYAKKWGIEKDYDDFWPYKKYYRKDLPLLTRLQYLDFKTYLPGDILTKVDRTAMQVSLETRIPFLSRELLEFVFGLPQEDRCPDGTLKGLLKEAYKGIIPDEILYRKKAGFTLPHKYYRRSGSTYRERMLKDLWKL